MAPPTRDLVLLHQFAIRTHTGKPDVDSSSFRLLSQVIVGVKLRLKTDQYRPIFNFSLEWSYCHRNPIFKDDLGSFHSAHFSEENVSLEVCFFSCFYLLSFLWCFLDSLRFLRKKKSICLCVLLKITIISVSMHTYAYTHTNVPRCACGNQRTTYRS